MDRINKSAGTTITIYHTFHDEVRHYQTHVWKCDGSCQHQPPYFGIVRRSMNRYRNTAPHRSSSCLWAALYLILVLFDVDLLSNRPPQPADRWFAEHQATCGGIYTKISEPEPKKKPAVKKSATNTEQAPRPRTMLDDFLAGSSKSSPRSPIPTPTPKVSSDIQDVELSSSSSDPVASQSDERPSGRQAAAAAALARFTKCRGRDSMNDESKGGDVVVIPDGMGPPQKRVKTEQRATHLSGTKAGPAEQISKPPTPITRSVSRPQSPEEESEDVTVVVECPVCGSRVTEVTINDHVDLCLWRMNGGDT